MQFPTLKLLAAGFLLIAAQNSWAQEEKSWRPLFNGEDLTGWINVNTAPKTWQVHNGMIVCNGRPRGFLRTDRSRLRAQCGLYHG